MLLIIAHHYVVNSGLTAVDGPIYAAPLSWQSLFLLEFGAWGKIGINCFVLITGYFMCQSKITVTKFVKLLFEVMFYRIVITSIFWISGYTPFTFKSLIGLLIPIKSIESGFTNAYLIFFLCIPFATILVQHLSEKQHLKLLLLSGFTYVFLASIPRFSVTMNYVSWFIVLFFIASYIRLYPKAIYNKTKFWGVASLLCVVLCIASVILGTYLGTKLNSNYTYYFVADSNKILALFSGICFFLFFKNLKIKSSKFINRIAASVFGVLLIHANSGTMRKWLWRDLLDNVGHYHSSLMPLHAIGSVCGVFVLCVCIDQLRIILIEKPFFRFFDKHLDTLQNKYKAIEDWVMAKISKNNIDKPLK